MNRNDYIEKSNTFLESRQFKKCKDDPTKSFQGKVQRCLLRKKKAFDKETYKTLYPSSSHPGLYFGLAKVHKVPDNSSDVTDLPLRPVISNIGTATYQLSKYLAHILGPLTSSEYTVESTKDFVRRVNGKVVEKGFKMVSFDVSSLFTNVPLDFTIELILDKVYNDQLVNTKLQREELRELLNLCTKEMHFSFNGQIFQQVDGVAMGNPLGPVLANIFMVELECQINPTLKDKMPLWFRYVDDTFTFIKDNEIQNVLNVLNSFHADIKFTHEIEKNGCISFLDVKITKMEDGSLVREIFRKATDTNIYLHWKSFSPDIWKIGTLKGLFRRAFIVCSTEQGVEKELKHLKFVFTKINKYPLKVIEKTLKELKEKMISEAQDTVGITERVRENVTVEVHPHIILPYKGKESHNLLQKFKKCISNVVSKEVIPRFVYKGKKLGSFFPIKDKIDTKHESNLVYYYKCDFDNDSDCTSVEDYVGETNVRYETRTNEHGSTDKNSAIFKHTRDANHSSNSSNFRIIARGYNKKRDRKLAEALFIRDLEPSLNEQVNSYKLKLFN